MFNLKDAAILFTKPGFAYCRSAGFKCLVTGMQCSSRLHLLFGHQVPNLECRIFPEELTSSTKTAETASAFRKVNIDGAGCDAFEVAVC